MTILRPQDLNFILSRLPKDVLSLIKERGLALAGGFIRATIAGEKPSDIDLFGPDKATLDNASAHLALSRHATRYTTENAYTVLAPPRIPVQFIHRWLFTSPEQIVATFDFTVCQASAWFADNKWCSMASDDFYADLAARRLVYTHPNRNEAPGGSMMRVRKFLAKGYNIQASSLAGVIARLTMGVRAYEEMNEQTRAQILTGLLHEVDPLTVIDGVDLVDEHEIITEQGGK